MKKLNWIRRIFGKARYAELTDYSPICECSQCGLVMDDPITSPFFDLATADEWPLFGNMRFCPRCGCKVAWTEEALRERRWIEAEKERIAELESLLVTEPEYHPDF